MRLKLTSPIIRFITLSLLLVPLCASAWIRSPATRFATLPEGATNPEGITVGPYGKVYVSTFAVGGTQSGVGEIFVFRSSGKFLRKIEVQGSSTLLLELAFHPTTGALLVIDFGNQQVLDVNPWTGTSTVFTTIPGGAGAGPNVLAFDKNGNVYISDSFQGIVWRTDADGTGDVFADKWLEDPLLTTSGVPPFGANGLAFNYDESVLYVANTGNDQIIKVPLNNSGDLTAGTPEVFVNSVNGADGLILDKHGNLWIAANQADEIVVVEPKEGRVIAKLGDFGGLTRSGAPVGLLFPASLVRSGHFIYVTNLALDLRLFDLAPPVDAPWAGDVIVHTISKIRARIPPVRGLDRANLF